MLLPGALTWYEVFRSHAGSNASESVVPEALETLERLGQMSMGKPRLVQVPRPSLTSVEFGRLAPLDGPRRRPTVERWGWIPVSHSEVLYQEMKLATDLTGLADTLLGDTMRESLAGRLPFLDQSSPFSVMARAEEQLEASNLWMFVSPPSDDAT